MIMWSISHIEKSTSENDLFVNERESEVNVLLISAK